MAEQMLTVIRQASGNDQSVLHLFETFSTSTVAIHAIRSFDEGLQLYGMLDVDAEGEEDVGVDGDGTC